MPWNKLPDVERCCGCVTDLKTAAAIIAVLGIVTSPALSWAVVRHSYVIRVSCFVTTAASRPDIVDINLNNILSFGFGANAGLGPSCLGPNKNKTDAIFRVKEDPASSEFVGAIKYIGWIVLAADAIFLISSVYFLYKIFHEPVKKAARIFIWSCIVSITLSFIYGMLYISACISVGGAFPIFEFAFSLFDVMLGKMGGIFEFLPKVDRCCYCTRKLKVACLLIDIWSMFATCQEFRMLLWPACESQYESSSGKMHGPLTVVKWMLFGVNLFLLASSFAYLLGIFMSFPITADVFICFGIASSVIAMIFAVMVAVQMIFARCTNPSDVLCLFLFVLLWSYFIIIVNSYRDNIVMSLLDRLPTVDKCCLCINLKWGTIIIAIIGIFSLGIGAYSSYSRPCNEKNDFQKFIDYFSFVVLAIQILVFITSIILIYGVIAHKPNTATWFIYAVLISVIVFLVFFVISLIAGLTSKKCSFPFIDVVSAILRTVVWVYFAVVVKSYQPEM